MSRDENAVEPGLLQRTLDPGLAERLVLRFPEGELIVLPSEDGKVELELELRGSPSQLPGWKPSIRRSEGILVVADEPSTDVRRRPSPACTCLRPSAISRPTRARAPSRFAGSRVDLLAATDTGDILVSGGTSVEASSSAGGVEVEKAFRGERQAGLGRPPLPGHLGFDPRRDPVGRRHRRGIGRQRRRRQRLGGHRRTQAGRKAQGGGRHGRRRARGPGPLRGRRDQHDDRRREPRPGRARTSSSAPRLSRASSTGPARSSR